MSVPTLYEWIGGSDNLLKLTQEFYPKVAYLEWGTRLAVVNSKPGAKVYENAPMPKWGWGETGGPYQSSKK